MSGPHDDAPRFEVGPKGGSPPMVISADRRPDDPLDLLPKGEPHRRWIALVQRANDAFGATVSGDVEREAALTVQTHARRLDQLTQPRNTGGHGLDDGDHLVRIEREKLERATAERDRIKALRAQRQGKWNAIGQLRQRVQKWVLHDLPGGVALEVAEPEPPSKLLRKGETLGEAITRIRAEIAALTERLWQIEKAPWPLAVAQSRAEQLIDKLAAEGAPRLDGAIAFNQDVGLPRTNHRVELHNVTPLPNSAPIGFVDTENAVGLLAWAFGPELKAKIRDGLTKIADDKLALSDEQRQTMTAQLSEERLGLERKECALINAADERGEIIDYRPDTSPQALLCVSLRTLTPAEMPRGTSRQHAFDVIAR